MIGIPSLILVVIDKIKPNQLGLFLTVICLEQITIPWFAYLNISINNSTSIAYSLDNLILCFIIYLLNQSKYQALINVLLAVVSIEVVLNMLEVFTFQDEIVFFQLSILGIIVSLMHLFNITSVVKEKPVLEQPIFWATIGLLFYLSITLVSNLAYQYLNHLDYYFYLMLNIIQLVAAIVFNGFIFISIKKLKLECSQ
jgi:hypothetical protein